MRDTKTPTHLLQIGDLLILASGVLATAPAGGGDGDKRGQADGAEHRDLCYLEPSNTVLSRSSPSMSLGVNLPACQLSNLTPRSFSGAATFFEIGEI